jgi:DNA-directed RNA polymerase subunit H (RpoH/RPB5)
VLSPYNRPFVGFLAKNRMKRLDVAEEYLHAAKPGEVLSALISISRTSALSGRLQQYRGLW